MASSPSQLRIAARFAGPATSGNGGYTSGRLAAYLSHDEPVTVTLRKPPPLETPLRVDVETGRARLLRGGDLVAEAERGAFGHPPPAAVAVEQATAAQSSYAGLIDHPFPTCFVCGTARDSDDGMRLAPGLSAEGRTACVWTPHPSVAAEADGAVAAAEFVWSALDCPGGWTSDLQRRPMVLGTMTAAHGRLPSIGRPYVVVGALCGVERRKTFTSSALYDTEGARLARAEHTWIAVDPASF